MDNICNLWWCNGKLYAQGLCLPHYRSVQRYGQVHMSRDARALYSHIQRDNILLTRIVEQCWRSNGHERVCNYCNSVEMHAPGCIVLTASGLLDARKGAS